MAYAFRFLAAVGWTIVHVPVYVAMYRAFALRPVRGDSVWLAWLMGWGLATVGIVVVMMVALPLALALAAPLLNAGLDPDHDEFLGRWSPDEAHFDVRHDPLGFLGGLAGVLAKFAGALALLVLMSLGGAMLAWAATHAFGVALVAFATTFTGAAFCLYPRTARWWAIWGW